MSARAVTVLARFPAHLEAARPGKQLEVVADSAARLLDELSARMAAVRRSHRLAHADLRIDLRRMGAMHGMGDADFAALLRRAASLEEQLQALAAAIAASDETARNTAAELVFDLFGISGAPPRLAVYAPATTGTPDLPEAAKRLEQRARLLTALTARREALRARIGTLARIHAGGNATVRAVLEAAASALDLELDLAKNERVKAGYRPVAAVTQDGTPGTTSYSYVVVARSASKNVDRQSGVIRTATGAATLSATDCNVISWVVPPDTRDVLVFRVASAGTPAETGMITPTALDVTVTSLRDTGLAVHGALEAATDDDLFHSRDRFWHSSFVRERARLTRRVDPLANRTLAVGATITLANLATLTGVDVNALVAAAVALDPLLTGAGATTPVPFSTAESLANANGFIAFESARVPIERSMSGGALAALLGVTFAQLKVQSATTTVILEDESTSVSEADARLLVAAFGLAAFPVRVLTIEQGIPLSALAAAAAERADRIVALAAVIGIAGATTATVLSPEQAATIGRRFLIAIDQILPVADEFIGMEENPLRREQTPEKDVVHGDLFPVYRRGFGRALLQLHVTGIGNRTIGPMLVNRDEGRGIGFAGAVADAQLLIFDEQGRVTLAGSDVTANAYAWKGACWAGNDDDPAAPRDFVFDGPGADAARLAVFAVAEPFDALAGDFSFPHAGDPLTVPGVGVGRTRFAFFVQTAHYSPADESIDPPLPIPLSPRPHAGFADGSVFAADGDPNAPAARITLSWLEHEAYAVRVLLPRRFALCDAEASQTIADMVEQTLERQRSAGVDIRVEYIDDRWILGTSGVGAANAADPILGLRGGSVLWTPTS